MPASRARTAICSAPFEWPSRPGLPTRILIRRPSASDTRSTLSRSSASASSSGAAAASRHAGGRAVLAEHVAQRARPLAGGGARPAAAASVAGMMFCGLVARGLARAAPARRPRRPGRAAERHSRTASIWRLLDRRVHVQDAAVLALLERRGLGARCRRSGRPPSARPLSIAAHARRGATPRAASSCRARPRPRRRARPRPPSRARAPSTSSSTSPSITFEPSKMSGYSSRSVS